MKKLNSIIKITTGLFFMALITSCEKEYVPVPAPPVGDISYATDIQPFFDAECVFCHNGSGIPLNLESSVSYNNLINDGYIDLTTPSSSKLYTKILPSGSMGQYTSTGKADITLLWIEQGAKNN